MFTIQLSHVDEILNAMYISIYSSMKDVPLFTADQQEVYKCFCFMEDRIESDSLFLDAKGRKSKIFLLANL